MVISLIQVSISGSKRLEAFIKGLAGIAGEYYLIVRKAGRRGAGRWEMNE